jgi:hypothetical protein
MKYIRFVNVIFCFVQKVGTNHPVCRRETRFGSEEKILVYNMGGSILDEYQLDSSHFPMTLYRIDYTGSQAPWCKNCGFRAASEFTPRRIAGLENAVSNHLDWSHRRYRSPFVSTFRQKRHAMRWANRWMAQNDDGCCWINEIRVESSDDVRVFRVKELVEELDISTHNLDPAQYHSEYLFLHRIPPELVVWSKHLQ